MLLQDYPKVRNGISGGGFGGSIERFLMTDIQDFEANIKVKTLLQKDFKFSLNKEVEIYRASNDKTENSISISLLFSEKILDKKLENKE